MEILPIVGNPNKIQNIDFDIKEQLKNDRMTISGGSFLDDQTPSDSGVVLDSESSELNESLMSNSGFDFDNTSDEKQIDLKTESLTKSDIVNSNLCLEDGINISAELTSSTHSTFDAENIVYRRRAKKNKNHSNLPKKRVSFHEDIFKNTKTDNIHIEHGFITYKSYPKKNPQQAGRYSWCPEGDTEDFNEQNHNVYRNACSDVLDYKSDIYENPNPNYIQYDNSGVFEYGPHDKTFYKCQCSDSNSSLESTSGSSNSDENNTRENYAQAKSNSCDCIGISNNNNVITNNCYYSEPSIEILDISNDNVKKPKSVWSKDTKPKSSCLKKSKRHTNILVERDLNSKVKKFNVHPLPDMNNLIDNSKMIFGSLKNIFSIPLPERGVPEGSEDLQSVCECVPENDSSNFNLKQKQLQRPFLSKSLDKGIKDIKGDSNSKQFIHNVDEQLRRKNENDLFAPTRQNSRDFIIISNNSEDNLTLATDDEIDIKDEKEQLVSENPVKFRNKFIINCESTVFEHTGVSYCYDKNKENAFKETAPIPTNTPVAQMSTTSSKISTFSSGPFKEKISNIFKNFTDSNSMIKHTHNNDDENGKQETNAMEISVTSSCSDKESIISDNTTTSSSFANNNINNSLNSPRQNKNRHLASPIHTKSLTTRYERARMSPDLFNSSTSSLLGRDSRNSLLSEEFDDILTITTSINVDKNYSDIVIVDYPEHSNDSQNDKNYLKPPVQSKTSLINRFLRNVTQKKLIDATIKKTNIFSTKFKTDKKLFENLYVKNVKPPLSQKDIFADFNAEIAMEIESSSAGDNRTVDGNEGLIVRDHFEIGVGEVSVEVFNGNYLHILRSENEILLKAFKLYTGYSREGFMTPVLVFLTDKTLYVTDLVRNRLCNKFVLPYSDLDVILMGPYGNTVLLSNGSRDMQQVLLAGGPYPADGLVSSLELCARRGGATLPAVGQLTLNHLAPLKSFVWDNTSVSKNDPWMYYSVVNIPAGALITSPEPMGPHIKGPLMHRTITILGVVESWQPGYFLLKAGVLYMFNEANQKIPISAISLPECQGCRRTLSVGRPHCFELLLKTGILQLAAPDEYVASEWLQSLVQAASGLFEMQEKNSTLGCTLIMTQNHLITLREDFSAPLRRLNLSSPTNENIDPNIFRMLTNSLNLGSNSDISSISASSFTTPTKLFERRKNSNMSTPTKVKPMQLCYQDEKSYTSMTSVYGKNSGVEILTCAALEEMVAIKVPAQKDNWWCIVEFSCQEVRESSDDLVVFFATNSELQRFLSMLEAVWHSKKHSPFPISAVLEDEFIGEHCAKLFSDLNKSWEPLLSAALGFPQ